jgi:excisionase family DNA binding protein
VRQPQLVIPDPLVTPTISVEDAGRLLGMSRPSAYAAVQRGDIPSIRIGRRLIIPTAKILAMLGLGGQP